MKIGYLNVGQNSSSRTRRSFILPVVFCVVFSLPTTDRKTTMSETFSESLIACLEKFVSKVNSDEDVDNELVAAICGG